MFSLYAAWLMRDAAVTAAGLGAPPDVIILVGYENEEFLAHRQLVSLHSGYLKSLLYDCNSPSIYVPNVMPDAFAPLLTFMYTGILPLDPTNVYRILLATQLLHMPQALELCREFLVHNPTPANVLPLPPTIYKPIPSKKAINLTQPIWSPLPMQPLMLKPTPDGPFQSVPQNSQPLSQPEPPGVTVPTTEITNSSSSSSPIFFKAAKKPKKVNDENKESQLDVACCDGPVQFHRVLNESYADGDGSVEGSKGKEEPSTSAGAAVSKKNNPHLHRDNLSQLRIALMKNKECEEETYQCSYCNQDFKSRFCFEKHVRRHINYVERAREGAANRRRQIQLLDMNVQYYPCKTCGSKFPSYYFVHKHRKMCHATEEDALSQSGSVGKETEASNHSTR